MDDPKTDPIPARPKWRDRLATIPGLAPQPHPESPENEQLQREIEFVISGAEDGGREAIARAILRFMLRRGYWPLGTRVEVTRRFKCNVTLPGNL